MTVEITKQTIDRTEVRRALALYLDPDATHEVRGLPSGKSRTVHGNALDAAVQAVEELSDGKGVYVTLNPVRPDLVGPARVADVLCRRRLLIDCDRKSHKDENASEEEKQEARAVANAVLDDLTERGWPKPAVIDSGNGWHLVYSIDLPNDKLSQQLLSKCLKALQSAHGTAEAEIDTKVHNVSRITKIPGTWTRKGPHTAERPHRMACLVSVPHAFVPVSEEQLKAVAGMGSLPPSDAHDPLTWIMTVEAGTDGLASYVAKAIEAETGKVAIAGEGTRNDTLNTASFNLGQLVHLGIKDREEIQGELMRAAERSGLTVSESFATIKSGMAAGELSPRQVQPKSTEKSKPGKAVRVPGSKLTIRASEIKTKKIRWLWPGRVPIGFITIFAGRTGLGKSFVTCDFAARISQGEDLPDGPSGVAGECRNVLFISEDPYEYVLAPRLLELNADLTRISFLKWEEMANYTIGDTDFLEEAWVETGDPVLIVIDPPTNFMGDVDEHKNTEVRRVLMHLVQWIKEKDCAIILITHVNKQSGKGVEALSRVIGSVAWVTTARVAHVFAEDPDVPGRCLFMEPKNNLSALRKGLAYRIESTETLATVKWESGEVSMTANEAMDGTPKPQSKGMDAVEWLTKQFLAQREWPSDELKNAAKEAGVTKDALWSKESRALPIKKRQVINAEGDRHWVWKADDGWPKT